MSAMRNSVMKWLGYCQFVISLDNKVVTDGTHQCIRCLDKLRHLLLDLVLPRVRNTPKKALVIYLWRNFTIVF